MLERDEVVRSLDGAWRLFLDRPDAVRRFDLSVEGFWRSFRAIVLVAPSYVAAMLARREAILTDAIPDDTFTNLGFAAERTFALGLEWVLLPLFFALMAPPLGLGRTYPTFVIAHNWCMVIAALPSGAIGLLYLIGAVGSEGANVLSLVVLIVVARYLYLVARRALAANVGLAIGAVVFEILLGLAIAAALASVFGTDVS